METTRAWPSTNWGAPTQASCCSVSKSEWDSFVLLRKEESKAQRQPSFHHPTALHIAVLRSPRLIFSNVLLHSLTEPDTGPLVHLRQIFTASFH